MMIDKTRFSENRHLCLVDSIQKCLEALEYQMKLEKEEREKRSMFRPVIRIDMKTERYKNILDYLNKEVVARERKILGKIKSRWIEGYATE